jgi:hypothetical protein
MNGGFPVLPPRIATATAHCSGFRYICVCRFELIHIERHAPGAPCQQPVEDPAVGPLSKGDGWRCLGRSSPFLHHGICVEGDARGSHPGAQ